MIIPIRCCSCNAVIADKWNYYIKQRNAKLAEKFKNKKITVEDINISNDDVKQKHFDDNISKQVLDELEVLNICCRRHFLAAVDLMEHI